MSKKIPHWFTRGETRIWVRPLNLFEKILYKIGNLPDLRVIDPSLEGMTFGTCSIHSIAAKEEDE